MKILIDREIEKSIKKLIFDDVHDTADSENESNFIFKKSSGAFSAYQR